MGPTSVDDYSASVTALKQPYPFKAMLAICSDLDETRSADVYFNTLSFLNSRLKTPFGQGLGLEVGNSIYFHMADDEFCYWNETPSNQGRIRELIQRGYIDSVHSFGDTATSRDQAAQILQHLQEHECHVTVWIDHAVAPTNLGRDIMRGFGDVSDSPSYHADLLLDYGIRYVWMGRVTSTHGQDVPISLRGIYDDQAPLPSLKTLAKEFLKVSLGALGNQQYRMHYQNQVLVPTVLRDGQQTLEFMRCNPNCYGVSSGETAAGLGDALRPEFLRNLIEREARSVLYTHLGKEIDHRTGFSSDSRCALENLAEKVSKGEILVTTTRRLLDYASMKRKVDWRVEDNGGRIKLHLSGVEDKSSLDGLSFRVPTQMMVDVYFGGEILDIQRVTDGRSTSSVICVPWKALDYA